MADNTPSIQPQTNQVVKYYKPSELLGMLKNNIEGILGFRFQFSVLKMDGGMWY